MAFHDESPAGPPYGAPDPAPVPVRNRERRGTRDESDGGTDEEPFEGCPLFPPNGTNSRGKTYAEIFQRAKLTEASAAELGLRLRLVSPDGSDGTSRPTFLGPLLPLDTTADAIHDRWGPGCYEVGLCRRTSNDRTKAEIVSRRVRLMPRTGDEWGERGERDVGREPWPLDLSSEDGQVTVEMREEIAYRKRVREELEPAPEPDPDDRYARHPGRLRGTPVGPGPGGYLDGDDFEDPFRGEAMTRPVQPSAPAPLATPPAPTLIESLSRKLAEDPAGLLTQFSAGLIAFKQALEVISPKAPPPPPAPTAQEIAAASAAAMRETMAPLMAALTSKPQGPDPSEVIRLQIEAMRADSELKLEQMRAAMAQQQLQTEQQFKLQLQQQQHEARARELMHQLETARSSSEQEKKGVLAELADLRKRLQSGDGEPSPTFLEQLADVLDTRFGEAIAPMVAAPMGRLMDALSTPAPAAPPEAPAAMFSPPAEAPPPAAPPAEPTTAVPPRPPPTEESDADASEEADPDPEEAE